MLLRVTVALLVLGRAGAALAGTPASEDGQEAAVARRIWSDLVCLCGRCRRLTLAACHCHEAKAERDKILGLVEARDLSSPEKADLVYREVVHSYVSRFGKGVLASAVKREAEWQGARDWLIFAALVVAAAAAIVAFEIGRRRWATAPSRRRRPNRAGR